MRKITDSEEPLEMKVKVGTVIDLNCHGLC